MSPATELRVDFWGIGLVVLAVVVTILVVIHRSARAGAADICQQIGHTTAVLHDGKWTCKDEQIVTLAPTK